MKEKYRAATFALTLVALAGYICIAGGVILLFQAGIVGGIASALPMIVGGLLMVGTANFGGATIDTAKNTAEMLQIMRQAGNASAMQPQPHGTFSMAPPTDGQETDHLTRLASSGYRSRNQ